jgi:hypothetical protein
MRLSPLRAKWFILASAASLSTVSFADNSARAFVTSEDRRYNLESVAHCTPIEGTAANKTWYLTVNDSKGGELQQITGFGAAWTDATVAVFDALPSAAQATLMSELFAVGADGEGIGLRLMRHTVGQSDLTPASIGEWSFDANGGVPDPSLSDFNLTEFVHYITSIHKLQLFSTIFCWLLYEHAVSHCSWRSHYPIPPTTTHSPHILYPGQECEWRLGSNAC